MRKRTTKNTEKMLVNTVLSFIDCDCVLTDVNDNVNYRIDTINIVSQNTGKVLFVSSIYDDDYNIEDRNKKPLMIDTGYGNYSVKELIFNENETDIVIDENEDENPAIDSRISLHNYAFYSYSNIKEIEENDIVFNTLRSSDIICILNHNNLLRLFYNGDEIADYDEKGLYSLFMVDKYGNSYSNIEKYENVKEYVYENRDKLFKTIPNMSFLTLTTNDSYNEFYLISLSNLFYDSNFKINLISSSRKISRITSNSLGFKFCFVSLR